MIEKNDAAATAAAFDEGCVWTAVKKVAPNVRIPITAARASAALSWALTSAPNRLEHALVAGERVCPRHWGAHRKSHHCKDKRHRYSPDQLETSCFVHQITQT